MRFRFCHNGHWPGPRSLATTSGVSVDVLSSGYMRCFSSPGLLRPTMDSSDDDPKGPGFPIRRSTDQRVLAPPRGLSQRATSFIASQCQGIHQMPLSRLIRSLETSRAETSPCTFRFASVTQHFSACWSQACATHRAVRLRKKTHRRRAVAKDPAYGQPHFPIHDVKDRNEPHDDARQTPIRHVQFAKLVELSELRRLRSAHRWWS